MKKNLFIISFVLVITGCSGNDDIFFSSKEDTKDSNPVISSGGMTLLASDYSDYICLADKELLKEMSTTEKLKTVMVYKLAEHISLVDSVYSIDITQNEALAMGINKEIYEECSHNILDINREIKDYKGDSNHKIYLLDYKAFIKEGKRLNHNKYMELTKSGDPQSGLITALDNAWHYNTFYPKISHSKVQFTCISMAAPLSVVNCSIEQWNNTRSGTGTGILGQAINITLNLFVSGSGVSAKLGFKTADSNGGRCNWRATDDYGITHE